MYPELNPYRPGSGLKPPALTGREADVDAFDLLVARTRRRELDRGMILYGLRGVGKTVLLNQFRNQAETASWAVVELEGLSRADEVDTLRLKLARGFYRAGAKIRRRLPPKDSVTQRALSTIGAFCESAGANNLDLGAPAAVGRADSGDLALDLEDLLEDLAPALIASSAAVGLFIDELQELDPDLLGELLSVQHRAGQRGWPFYIIGAGLPVLPARLAAARTYAERLFDYRQVGALTAEASQAALVEPAVQRGVDFDDDALAALLEAANGYPFFIQTFGKSTWDVAVEKKITADDARLGIAEGRRTLDEGFYPSRWSQATPVERKYLLAMAALGEERARTTDIAAHLGVPTSKLSTARQQLLDKGVLFAPSRGIVEFAVPGMLAYIERQYAY
ncbi:AAA family ATPase [Agromyces sp. NPDC055658]